MFTTNRVKAAPVLYDQETLARNAGGIRAIIANAGNANACTGPRGMDDARQMAALTAAGAGLPAGRGAGALHRRDRPALCHMQKLAQGIADWSSPAAQHGAPFAARAIMTTDTRPKVSRRQLDDRRRSTVTISGFCKGSGMIHPNMATMLAIITTDAIVAPELLQAALRAAIDRSINRVSVDGDMSTNDTALLLASGAAGVTIGAGELPAFTAALTEACVELAKQIARDGEGATRLVEITVTGALDEAPGAYRGRQHRALAAGQDRCPRRRPELGPRALRGRLQRRGDRSG